MQETGERREQSERGEVLRGRAAPLEPEPSAPSGHEPWPRIGLVMDTDVMMLASTLEVGRWSADWKWWQER